MWLLLMSLLISDPSPHGDGDGVTGCHGWRMRRGLLVPGPRMAPGGQWTAPRGLGTPLTRARPRGTPIRGSFVDAAVQHKQRAPPFHLACAAHDDNGHSLSHQDLTEIIHRSHIPALVVSPLLEEGKSIPAFQLKSDTLPAMHLITRVGDIHHVAMDIIKDRPGSGSARFRDHRTAAPGPIFRAPLLEKPKSRAPAAAVKQQKLLTKRCCAATTVVISCRLEEDEERSALDLKETSAEQITEPLIRKKEVTLRATGIRVPRQFDGQQPLKALVSQHDVSQTASLHPGSSSVKTPDTSQLRTRISAASVMKKNERLSLVDGSALHKSLLKQFSLKAASGVGADSDDDNDDDDDGFDVKRQLLLVSGVKKEPVNKPAYWLRAAQEDNKEDFNGRIITKQVELRLCQDGESKAEQSHTNTVENGSRKRLAFISQTDSVYKTDNNYVDPEQVPTEVREEALAALLLPDTEMETQSEPPRERKLILIADTGWKTVKIPVKEPVQRTPMTKVTGENFIIEADDSKCKCLKETMLALNIYATDGRERIDVKPAESIAKVTKASAYTKEQVKGTTEKVEPTEETLHEDVSRNRTEQEESLPSEEPIITSPPPYEDATDTVTARTGTTVGTTTANAETTQSPEAFQQSSAGEAGAPPSTDETPMPTMGPKPGTDTGPGCTECITRNVEPSTGRSLSGLKIREDVPATEAQGDTGNKEQDAMIRPETVGKEATRPDPDPGAAAYTSKPLEPIHDHAANDPSEVGEVVVPERKNIHTPAPQPAGETVPACGGLVHRTEAGWKHCVERFAGAGSGTGTVPWRETADAPEEAREAGRGRASAVDPDDDDENDHFYYSDGVLRRVRMNFYPYDRI